ncbi:MAG: DUF3575 domain-containing protein [Tannerellaceae bacterium]|nr:DUF3575 domain-containing protein [Tannerellaceae bacterium]
MKRSPLIIVLILSLPLLIRAQELSIQSNILYWTTTTPNVTIEYGFTDKLSLNVLGSYNPWQYGSREENKKLKHWLVQPELRLWNCERNVGSFWGFHLQGGAFNAGGVKLPLRIWQGLKDNRYEGYFLGGGVSYGYQWILSPRWNLEATFGFGYSYIHYKQYECRRCGEYIGNGHHHYFGPTRIGVSIVYLVK